MGPSFEVYKAMDGLQPGDTLSLDDGEAGRTMLAFLEVAAGEGRWLQGAAAST
jgi:hypothetical protein